MDRAERQRLKQLANDSIIATYGYDTNESRLAVALEASVEQFEFIATGCDHCKYCDVHGEVEDNEIHVDASEILRIHGELKTQVQALKDLYVKLAGALAESDIDDLVEELASQIEEAAGWVDELESEVIP